MSCKDALVEKAPVVSPDQTIDVVVKTMRTSGVSMVPVVDSDRKLVGIFSYSILLEDTLPVSLAIGAGGEMGGTSVRIPAAPGMVKRLRQSMMGPVSTLMQRPANLINPDTSLESAIREVREAGGSVVVVEPQTNKYVGVVSDASLLAALEKTG